MRVPNMTYATSLGFRIQKRIDCVMCFVAITKMYPICCVHLEPQLLVDYLSESLTNFDTILMKKTFAARKNIITKNVSTKGFLIAPFDIFMSCSRVLFHCLNEDARTR